MPGVFAEKLWIITNNLSEEETMMGWTCSDLWRNWLLLGLTHWGQEKMVDILHTTFSKAFSWMEWKLFCIYSNFTGICSRGSGSQYVIIGSGNGLALNRWHAIVWSNDGLVYWVLTQMIFTQPCWVNSLRPSNRYTIWTNDHDLMSIKTQGTNFGDI